jgi:hypothetical protein
VRSLCAAALCLCPQAIGHAAASPGAMWVEEIGLERLSQRRGTPRVARTIRDQPIRLGGVEYPHRNRQRASISEFVIDLKANAARFTATVGIDDAIQGNVGSVVFEVWADDTRASASSGPLQPGDAPKSRVGRSQQGARPDAALTIWRATPATSNDDVGWAGR